MTSPTFLFSNGMFTRDHPIENIFIVLVIIDLGCSKMSEEGKKFLLIFNLVMIATLLGTPGCISNVLRLLYSSVV